MKRLMTVACGVGIGIALVPAVSSGAGGRPFDSVSGAGDRGNLLNPTESIIHFTVNASDGPLGVSGTYSSSAANQLLDFRGDVTCLYVNGDQAVVGGVITSGGEPGEVGTGFAVGFVDNPSPTPDVVTLTDTFAPTPVDCVAEAAGLFAIPTLTFVHGNVTVNDAA